MSTETVICRGFDGKDYVTPVAQLIPRTSIYGIVISDNRVLLSKQSNGYDLPGGGIEEDETDEQGLEREVSEETGLLVKAKHQVGEQKEGFFKRTHSDGSCIHSFMRYYVCRLVGGEISTEGFDEAEKSYAAPAEWLPLNQLDSIIVASTYDWRPLVKEMVNK